MVKRGWGHIKSRKSIATTDTVTIQRNFVVRETVFAMN